MALDFPANPNTGEIFDSWRWDGVRWVAQPGAWTIPLAFVFMGLPLADAMLSIPIIANTTVPAGLLGTTGYQHVLAAAAATFTLNKISGGVTTALGTITFNTTSNTAITLAGAGGTAIPGDVLQVIAPATQDTTMADVGITIPVLRTS